MIKLLHFTFFEHHNLFVGVKAGIKAAYNKFKENITYFVSIT